MIIAFGYTWPALFPGHKSVTRRYWKPSHAAKLKPGMICQAYDKSPLYGGKHIADIEIVSVTEEPLSAMPDSDYEAEGFDYLQRLAWYRPKGWKYKDFSHEAFDAWRKSGDTAYTVRFMLRVCHADMTDIVRGEQTNPKS